MSLFSKDLIEKDVVLKLENISDLSTQIVFMGGLPKDTSGLNLTRLDYNMVIDINSGKLYYERI